jgi:pyridoxine 5-phosphate synthase
MRSVTGCSQYADRWICCSSCLSPVPLAESACRLSKKSGSGMDAVSLLKAAGIRTSMFLDPSVEEVELAPAWGVDRVELYTESYARTYGTADGPTVLRAYAAAAARAGEVGLGVNAGHDLDQQNLRAFAAAIPNLLEVSIGHALVSEALYAGLETTVRRYLALLA